MRPITSKKRKGPILKYRLKPSIKERNHNFSTGETYALMIKTLRVRKQIAQPQGMCQPFSMERRSIEIFAARIPSNTAEDFVSLRGGAALQGELQQRKEP